MMKLFAPKKFIYALGEKKILMKLSAKPFWLEKNYEIFSNDSKN